MSKIKTLQENIISLSYCKPTVIEGESSTLDSLFTWNNIMIDLKCKLIAANVAVMRANNRV